MTDEQWEALRKLIQDWQDEQRVKDQDMVTALRQIAQDY